MLAIFEQYSFPIVTLWLPWQVAKRNHGRMLAPLSVNTVVEQFWTFAERHYRLLQCAFLTPWKERDVA
jgi:hypothetical protein